MYGTLLSLTANGLKVPFTELLALVTERFRETRTNAHQPFAAIQADE